jgi:hypothetical protein
VPRVVLLALALLTPGCALMHQHVELRDLAPVQAPRTAPRKAILVGLIDARPDPSRVGVVKNGWGLETAMVLSDDDVAAVLSESLATALEAGGWTVTRAPAGSQVPAPEGDDWVVLGWVHSVMSEPSVGLWAIDLLAEAELTLEVHTASRVYRRTVRGFELSPDKLVCFTGCAEEGLKAAMAAAVREAAAALVELSARLPRTGPDSAPVLLLLRLEGTP